MRILAKVGGAQLEALEARRDLACSVKRAWDARHEIALVHGGGNQIRELVRRLGLTERYHEGLRITDAATADVVLMVLAGLVNKELVQVLVDAGLPAAGVSGADGASFHAHKTRSAGVDLGYVGHVAVTDTRLVETLIQSAFLPVIATAAPLAANSGDARDHFYNINADLAAGPLARALAVDALLFLTDVPGVLDGDGVRLATLTPQRCAELRAAGVIRGGMIPKVEAALCALRENPTSLVKVAPAAGQNAVLEALEPTTGTRFVLDASATCAPEPSLEHGAGLRGSGAGTARHERDTRA